MKLTYNILILIGLLMSPPTLTTELNNIDTKYLILKKSEDYWPIDNDGRYKPENYEPFEHGLLYLFWEIINDANPQYFLNILNDSYYQGITTDSGNLKKNLKL